MENYCCQKFLFTGSTPSIIASVTPLSPTIPLASLSGGLTNPSVGLEKAPCSGAPPVSTLFCGRGGERGVQDSPPASWAQSDGGAGVCLKQKGPGPVRVEVCASVLARACKSAAEEVVAAHGRGSGSPGLSAQESCIDMAGRERSSRGAGQRPQRGPGLSRSLEPGVSREEE
jgi:hypothetical protein